MKKIIAGLVLTIGFLFAAQSTNAQTRYRYECRPVQTYYGRIIKQCGFYPIYRNYGQWRRDHNRNRRYHRYEHGYRYEDRYDNRGRKTRVRVRINF